MSTADARLLESVISMRSMVGIERNQISPDIRNNPLLVNPEAIKKSDFLNPLSPETEQEYEQGGCGRLKPIGASSGVRSRV